MKSYFQNPGQTQYCFETVPERLKKLGEDKPDRIAMVMYNSKDDRHQINRKDLYQTSERFALAIMKLGIKKGDLIAYCANNSITWLAYDAGIMEAGGIPVHLHYGACDMKVVLNGCSMVILEAKKDWDAFLAVAQIDKGGKVTCKDCPSLKTAIAISAPNRPANALLAEELMADTSGIAGTKFPNLDPEDIAFINLLPGKTGNSARVTHSHFDTINCPSFIVGGLEFGEDDVRFSSRYMSGLPDYPFHYIQRGSKCVDGDPEFLNDPKSFEISVDIMKREGCTLASIIPQNLKEVKDYGFRIRAISSTGEMLTKEMISNALLLADMVVGMNTTIEVLRVSQMIYTKNNINEYQPGLLGPPSRGVEIKIVNDQKKTVELGEVGSVCVRSPWMAKVFNEVLGKPMGRDWYQTNYRAMMLKTGDILVKN